MATKLGSLTLDLICRTGNFTQSMRDASNSANRELGRIEQSTNGATNAIKGLAVAALGSFSVHQVIAYTDSYTNLQNRLKLVTNSQQELNTATKDTFAIAQATAQSWGSVAQVYQRFAENSSRLGITMQQTASLTDTVSKAISISGASASSAEAALMQFGQALASGVLRGEEFNSIAEQAPALLKAIATGLGVNIGELRKMAGEGQLTGDVVIKALNKAKTSVDDLFSKTDFTIAQSFTQLNDSVTKFVGEAGSGSGAAKTLASSIKMVADNVDTIASAATLGGVAFLTKAVISQTIAMRESVAASMQRRLADTAALESQVRLSALEVQRMRQVTALAMTELNLARQEFNSATTRSARATATIRLTQAEVAHNIALNQSTVAIGANTAAQNALNSSRLLGTRALALVGGPIGALTLGVTALAAGYMYMESQAAKANQKLSEQADVANKTKEELLALEGAQKKGAIVDLKAAFDSQNKSLYALTFQFKTYMRMIEDANKGNLEVARISDLVHAGKISEIDALSQLNKMNVITPEQFKQGESYVNSLENTRKEANNSANALKVFGINVELMGNKSSNAASKVKEISKEAVTTSEKVKALDGAIQKFISNSLSSSLQNEERLKLYNKGLTKEAADLLLNARDAAGITGTNKQLPMGALVLLGRELITTNEIKKVEDERNKSEKERTKELEKQQNVLRLSSQILSNASKYNFGAIEAKNGLPSGTLSAIHAIETGNTGLTNQVNKKTGATGGFQFLAGTAKQYGVNDRKDLAQSAEGAGKYMGYLLKLFKGDLEKAVRAYHAGEGNIQRGTNIGKYNNDYWAKFQGFVAGKSGFSGSSKDFTDSLKNQTEYLQKTIQEIDQLREQYSNADVVRNKKRIAEISEAERLGQTQLISKINERYSNESRLAELQFEEQINGFNWTEDEKLKNQAEINKTQISLSTELNDIQKQLAKESIDDQLAYSLEKSKLAKEQRLLQSKEFYMSELQLAKAKYDIERRLLDQSNEDPKEKAFKSQMLALQNHVDMNRRLKDASTGWDTIQAQMNGSTGRYQVSQDKFSRMGASQNLFDTQMADVENQEQEPGADLQKLAEVREQIWAAHNQRMIDIENQYQTDSLNLQLTQAQQLTGSFANMFKGILGESSGAYKTMFAMQQGFALTQAGMNLWSSVSDAYAKEPGTLWQKVAAGAKAALDQGTFLAMIQAITPQGFATGGHITGKGTGTSDDIPIMASNGEFMMKASAVSKLGLSALNYMNITGEIPDHSNYMSMNSQSNQSDLSIQKFKDGGVIGVPRLNYTDVDSRRFNSIPKNSSQGEGGGDITIQVNVTDSGVNTSGGNTQNQKQLGDAIGNAVRAVIMKEKRQGGLLSK
ncbi:tape measure protein [Acinetobacter bereziniae]|uniref:tape measure protein n=1 Tax=Acinetobacter bereziniae TaxID=106648 RepID=UPI0019001C4C|nr:tape measure protein [Acinetobacter bereziniae]MBJ8450339.1 tape measure protein [Acinetobacter bereziniae]MBJ8454626.1 tape measure protein [Acinetobacter bereziniae]